MGIDGSSGGETKRKGHIKSILYDYASFIIITPPVIISLRDSVVSDLSIQTHWWIQDFRLWGILTVNYHYLQSV